MGSPSERCQPVISLSPSLLKTPVKPSAAFPERIECCRTRGV